MATTYTLKRKLFAGTAFEIQEAQKLVQDANGKAIRGMGTQKKALAKSVKGYDAAKAEMYKQFEAYKKGLSGDALKNARFGEWAKGAGKQYYDAAVAARSGVKSNIQNIGAKTGKDISKAANSRVTYNAGQRSVSGAKGLGTWMRNTWRSGAGGKAALIGGGIALAGGSVLAAKGAFGGNKNNNAQQY